MDTKTSLAQYLGAGLSQQAAAEAVGVSAAYVSQLLSGDQEFAEAVRAQTGARVSRYVEMDELTDKIQHTALARLSKVIALETRAQVLMKAAETMDRMQRRSAPAQQADNSGVGMVRLNLSSMAASRYTISVDTQNRVIQVDASTMVPASGAQIAQMAEVVMADSQGERYERGTEAGILQIPAGSLGGPEAYGAIPAPASARPSTTGSTSGAGGSPAREWDDASSDAFDGTVGSML